MSALALSCGLFVVWTLVGYAVLNGLGARRDPLQSLLLGPTVGVATLTLLLFWLSRGGLPIGRFGVRLGVAAVSASVGVLVWCRPRFAGRRYAPFAVVLLAAAVFTGRPMLDFGFDWLSYVNDDMGNYTLGALRLLNHGFFEVPDIRTVIDGRDYSLQYWAMDMSGHRPGSQLLLAWVASITRLTVHQVFMPTIVALHLVMVSAAGGLVPGYGGAAAWRC